MRTFIPLQGIKEKKIGNGDRVKLISLIFIIERTKFINHFNCCLMKNYRFYTKTTFAFLLLMFSGMVLLASTGLDGIESDTANYHTYRGKLVDKLNNEPVVYADITVPGENTSTVSNSQGDFVIKISHRSRAHAIRVSHLGYKTAEIPLNSLNHRHNVIRIEPAAVALNQVYVRPGPVEDILKKVLESIGQNYPVVANEMTGFYRESIKKRRSYVSLSEAVVDIYKASYKSLFNDQVRIIKGRKGSNVKRMDTLLFKLQGGPTMGLLLDIIKNPYVLLNREMIYEYRFSLVNEVKKNGRLYYVIAFDPIDKARVPSYSGKYYIDVQSYALASAEFQLELNQPDKAASLFIKKKPFGARVSPLYAPYLVKYRQQGDKWYYHYAKGEVAFKIKWKRRLFNSIYSTAFELAITDRSAAKAERIKGSERFKPNEIFAESVEAFSKSDYWGKYNYIEPNQSIESAIRRFKRLLRK